MKNLSLFLLVFIIFISSGLILERQVNIIDNNSFEQSNIFGYYNEKTYIFLGGTGVTDHKFKLLEVSAEGTKELFDYSSGHKVEIYGNKLFVFMNDMDNGLNFYDLYYTNLDDNSKHSFDLSDYSEYQVRLRACNDDILILEAFNPDDSSNKNTFLVYDLESKEIINEFDIGPMSSDFDPISYIVDDYLYIYIDFFHESDKKLYKINYVLGDLEVIEEDINTKGYTAGNEFHYLANSINSRKEAFIIDVGLIDEFHSLIDNMAPYHYLTYTLNNKLYLSYDGIVDVYNSDLELVDSFDSVWDNNERPSIIGENQFVLKKQVVYGMLIQTEYVFLKIYDIELGEYVYKYKRTKIGSSSESEVNW